MASQTPPWDTVIIGSGFGGSVAALRLAERGQRVLVLERGRRFQAEDFAKTTWNSRRYLWAPRLGCYGILQMSPMRHVLALHGAGVGGGSLGYANVLMEPEDRFYEAEGFRGLGDWRRDLAPHFATAKRMLGVATNPKLWPGDAILRDIAREEGVEHTFRPTDVGVFFGEPGQEGVEVADPFFGGKGPRRTGCIHCGGCMVGCRHGAKNTVDRNYLYLAEQLGVDVRPMSEVREIRPLGAGAAGGARYAVCFRDTGMFAGAARHEVQAKNVVVAAGALGSMRLLLRCRDRLGTLPDLSARLGHGVRTNNEAILGSVSRRDTNAWQGIAITSVFRPDEYTSVEPVRYSPGSSALRFLTAPLVDHEHAAMRVAATLGQLVAHPMDTLRSWVLPGWAERATILLVMQTLEGRMRVRAGRGPWTLWRDDIVSEDDGGETPPRVIPAAHRIAKKYAARTDGVLGDSTTSSLFGVPMTAHLIGGCGIGANAETGVVGTDLQVFGYPGLYVMDGSVLPANPGYNPSLTITAMAEWGSSGQ